MLKEYRKKSPQIVLKKIKENNELKSAEVDVISKIIKVEVESSTDDDDDDDDDDDEQDRMIGFR